MTLVNALELGCTHRCEQRGDEHEEDVVDEQAHGEERHDAQVGQTTRSDQRQPADTQTAQMECHQWILDVLGRLRIGEVTFSCLLAS